MSRFFRTRRGEGGFTLLEVMIALSIMVACFAILLKSQGNAVVMTRESRYIITATQLAQEKMAEVRFQVEKTGVYDRLMTENGDFDDFGDEAFNLEFGDEFEDFHYEWWVSEMDLAIAGDILSMAGEAAGDESQDGAGVGAAGAGTDAVMGMLSGDLLTQQIGRYFREVRVRVWWGDSSKEAEELGNEVVLIGHISDPRGGFSNINPNLDASEAN
ncbi:MAG: prepilin-type N-terminal cleavage/methylation domain-containing protein [Deltaproteobacteria bacterium]|nr:MAG: prepilin-type N-terminal cleavage/methylation domain-containing protein [Deltaproteobacteria bacterium]